MKWCQKQSYLICKTLKGYQCNLGDNHKLEHGLKLSKLHWDHTILGRGWHKFDSCILYLLDSFYLEYILVFDTMRMDPQNILQNRHKLMNALWLDAFGIWHCLHKDWENKGVWEFLLLKKTQFCKQHIEYLSIMARNLPLDS